MSYTEYYIEARKAFERYINLTCPRTLEFYTLVFQRLATISYRRDIPQDERLTAMDAAYAALRVALNRYSQLADLMGR